MALYIKAFITNSRLTDGIDDDESIKNLTETTARCFSSERVLILYIRAQVTRIDLKVNLAISEVIRTYRRAILGAVAVAGVPTGPTTTRTASAVDVCRRVIACFGLPTVTGEMVLQILRANILDDLGNNLIIALTEGIAALGLVRSLFVVSSAVSIPLVVPATSRLLLMLATDMILILARSFQEAAVKNIGQPLAKDLGAAARAYRPFAQEIHKQIKKLVPRKNPVACFRTDKITVRFEKIIEEYKSWDVHIVVPTAGSFGNSDDEKDLDPYETLIDDMEDAKEKLKEELNLPEIENLNVS